MKQRAISMLVFLIIVTVLTVSIFFKATTEKSEVEVVEIAKKEKVVPTKEKVVEQTVAGTVTLAAKVTANKTIRTAMRATAKAEEVIERNPGCVTKDLNSYTAIDLGTVYHHPSIVHYAKLMGDSTTELNFREYTSVLSAYKFIKPEKIMFHTYHGTTISGEYWAKINKWMGVRIEVSRISPIRKIGGKKVKWIQHVADYVKLNMVLKYGGIALDFDVVIINGQKLKHQQKYSECVLAGEFKYINGGFYSCIQNSSFIAKWLESYYYDYQPRDWVHNISYRPLDLLTDQSNDTCYNVHVDNTICANPLWIKKRRWLKTNGVKWRTKTAAHYYLKSDIPYDGEDLLKQKFPLAQLIQYVHNHKS